MHSDTTTWLNGQVSEHCGELIDSTHKTILGLAKRFNIKVADVLAAEPAHSTETYFFSGQYYSRAAANADFNAVYHAVKKDLIAAGIPTLYNELQPRRLRPRLPERVRLDRNARPGRPRQSHGAASGCGLQHRVRR